MNSYRIICLTLLCVVSQRNLSAAEITVQPLRRVSIAEELSSCGF